MRNKGRKLGKYILLVLIPCILIQCSFPTGDDMPYYVEVFPLSIVDIDGNNYTELSDNDIRIDFLYPISDELIFIMVRGSIYHFNLNTMEKKYIETIDIDQIRDRVISSDGDKLIFVGNNGEGETGYYQVDIYSVDLYGNNLRNLTKTPNIMEASPSFSKDGNKLIFATKSDAIVANLPDDEGQTISYYDFKLDSTYKILHHKNDFTIGYSSNGVLFGTHYYHPRFGFSGKNIYFFKRSETPGDSLLSYNLSTGEFNALAVDVRSLYGLHISNLRDQLIYNGNDNLLISIDIDGNNKTVLYDDYFTYGCDFSDDGEKVIFWSENYDDQPMYIIKKDGTDRIKLQKGQKAIFTKLNDKIFYVGYKKIRY